MKGKILLILGFCVGMFISTKAQSSLLNGQWKGIITQDAGGYMPEYSFELYFTVRNGKVTGRSYVYIEDGEIFAIMEFSGESLSDKMLILQETRIVDHRKEEGMEWCMKKMDLVLKEDEDGILVLEGFWSGSSVNGECVPGKIKVTQQIQRA